MPIFFYDMHIQIFYQVLNWVICFHINEKEEFFLYKDTRTGYKNFNIYMIHKYLYQSVACLHLLNGVFEMQNLLIFMKPNLSSFFF